jgi:hypothetical protein
VIIKKVATSVLTTYFQMDSTPAYPQSGNIFVCTTPAWGVSNIAQYAAVSMITYPAMQPVPLINAHRSNAQSTLEYHFNFYQVCLYNFYDSCIQIKT